MTSRAVPGREVCVSSYIGSVCSAVVAPKTFLDGAAASDGSNLFPSTSYEPYIYFPEKTA